MVVGYVEAYIVWGLVTSTDIETILTSLSLPYGVEHRGLLLEHLHIRLGCRTRQPKSHCCSQLPGGRYRGWILRPRQQQ